MGYLRPYNDRFSNYPSTFDDSETSENEIEPYFKSSIINHEH